MPKADEKTAVGVTCTTGAPALGLGPGPSGRRLDATQVGREPGWKWENPPVRIIAIDGPAGSGKSTVAATLAERLGLGRLDTGAMYRAVALAAIRRGVDVADSQAVARVAADVQLEVGERVWVDGVDSTSEIRQDDVNAVVSTVSAIPEVRAELVARQRRWVDQRGGGVVEGRDIGSVVFPDADLKVFLTADEKVRAHRRARETGRTDPNTVAQELTLRDELDSARAHSPLAVAPGAVVIDTTGRTVSQVVDELLDKL